MTSTPTVRPLPALNENYSPARPWACITRTTHTCQGPVVGAVGAIPVCADGARTETAQVVADRAAREALLATPQMQAALAAEARVERHLARFS